MYRTDKIFNALKTIAVISLMSMVLTACGNKETEQATDGIVFEEIAEEPEAAVTEAVNEEPEEPEIQEEPVEPAEAAEAAEADENNETDSSEGGTGLTETVDDTEQDGPASPDTVTEDKK